MASSGTGCDPVVIESDENNSSQNELDSENNFKCCQGKKTYKAEDVLRLKKEKNVCWLFFHIVLLYYSGSYSKSIHYFLIKLNLTLELTLPLFIVNRR